MTAKILRDRRQKEEEKLNAKKAQYVETVAANIDGKERRNTADDTAAGRAQGKSSKWIEKIRRDQLEKKAKEEEAKKEREARWKLLLDSDDEGDEKTLNYKDIRGPDMVNFLD